MVLVDMTPKLTTAVFIIISKITIFGLRIFAKISFFHYLVRVWLVSHNISTSSESSTKIYTIGFSVCSISQKLLPITTSNWFKMIFGHITRVSFYIIDHPAETLLPSTSIRILLWIPFFTIMKVKCHGCPYDKINVNALSFSSPQPSAHIHIYEQHGSGFREIHTSQIPFFQLLTAKNQNLFLLAFKLPSQWFGKIFKVIFIVFIDGNARDIHAHELLIYIFEGFWLLDYGYGKGVTIANIN